MKINSEGFTIADIARQIAIEAHDGTKNKHDGEMYLLHVSRVATFARRRANMFALTEAQKEQVEAVAWLHDVVEDTDWGLEKINTRLTLDGFGTVAEEVCSAVGLLTKTQGLHLADYYNRIKPNPVARVVKLADMHDNFRRNHQIQDADTRLRMAKKYSLGMDILG